MTRLTPTLPLLLLTATLCAQQPPVIDRELFFGDPEISGAQISPDGKYIAFLKPLNKTPQCLGEEDRRALRQSQTHHE